MPDSLKERFDEAFYNLMRVGDEIEKLSQTVDYAGNLIKLNKIKQNQIEQILKGQDNGQQ